MSFSRPFFLPGSLDIIRDLLWSLFFARHAILDIAETELVLLPAITCQNLRNATYWHLRGCLTVGVTRDEVKAAQRLVKLIAQQAGKVSHNVGRISDVIDED